jgi:hypothetical protein
MTGVDGSKLHCCFRCGSGDAPGLTIIIPVACLDDAAPSLFDGVLYALGDYILRRLQFAKSNHIAALEDFEIGGFGSRFWYPLCLQPMLRKELFDHLKIAFLLSLNHCDTCPGAQRCRNFLVADRAGGEIGSTRGFRGGRSADGAGVRSRWLCGLPFRREERLGRLARARDPLAIITEREVMLLPMG